MKRRKFKYVAISENDKEQYSTIKDMEKDIKNFGNTIVRCYTYKNVGEGNDSELTSEDYVRVYVNGKRIPKNQWCNY